MTPFRLHFDIRAWDDFHRERWAARLAGLTADPGVQITADPAAADAILDLGTNHGLQSGRALTRRPVGYHEVWPDKTLEWDASDFPSGRLPGLYCSLSRRLFDPTRHRSFCYPWRYNTAVRERPPDEAECLFGFSGSLSSTLRHRLMATLAGHPAGHLRRTDNLWSRMFAEGADPAKQLYADDLARCRFGLCPRGNGASSIRLFEVMQTGRVPVLIADQFVPPQCVPWDRCSVRIAERDLAHVPAILAERAADWPALAREARRQWLINFSEARLLAVLADECRALLATRRQARPRARWVIFARTLPVWTLFRAQAARRAVHARLRALKS